MEWKKAKKKEPNVYEIPERWLHLYYYEALNILFRFENSLRIFVYVILKNSLNEKWIDAVISEGKTIKSETRKRITQAKAHGYLGFELSSPMLYLNSGEIIDIITSENYWKFFAPYFKTNKTILISKLQEIGTVRNSLAHFRPIKEDDIELIKQNTKHIMIEVENTLNQISGVSDRIPSNHNKKWFIYLMNLTSDNCTHSLYRSRDDHWIRLEINYTTPLISNEKIVTDYHSLTICNLRTEKILEKFKGLKKHCIYIHEFHSSGSMKNNTPKINKKFSIIFSNQTLEKNEDEIIKNISELYECIDDETNLVTDDNMARGQLIDTKTVSMRLTKNGNREHWSFNLNNLMAPIENNDDVEFWGLMGQYEIDFIAGKDSYPWMPSTISEEEILF